MVLLFVENYVQKHFCAEPVVQLKKLLFFSSSIFGFQADILFERLSFSAEWYQEEANLMRPFLFNFYPADGSVELVSVVQKIK